MPDRKYTITPIKISIEISVEEIIRARESGPSLVDRKLEVLRRQMEKEHAERYRLLDLRDKTT